jgi:hypothetical protein
LEAKVAQKLPGLGKIHSWVRDARTGTLRWLFLRRLFSRWRIRLHRFIPPLVVPSRGRVSRPISPQNGVRKSRRYGQSRMAAWSNCERVTDIGIDYAVRGAAWRAGGEATGINPVARKRMPVCWRITRGSRKDAGVLVDNPWLA